MSSSAPCVYFCDKDVLKMSSFFQWSSCNSSRMNSRRSTSSQAQRRVVSGWHPVCHSGHIGAVTYERQPVFRNYIYVLGNFENIHCRAYSKVIWRWNDWLIVGLGPVFNALLSWVKVIHSGWNTSRQITSKVWFTAQVAPRFMVEEDRATSRVEWTKEQESQNPRQY